MKKLSLMVLLATSTLSGALLADNHTASIGYAQSKVQDFKNIRGVNLQYRYEFNSPVSVVGTFTYMKGDDEYNYSFDDERGHDSVDVKYYSLLAGPAYRINQYVSLYALGGIARVKASGESTWEDLELNYRDRQSSSSSSTSFAYGLGVIFNPLDYLSVNVGYEGTRADLGEKYSINGFNIGIGYRF